MRCPADVGESVVPAAPSVYLFLSTATYELINQEFVCESRGAIDVKGKWKMETWFVRQPSELQ